MARRRSLAGSLGGSLAGSLSDRSAGGAAPPPAFSGVLDDIVAAGGSMPNAAYSVSHRLSVDYTGPLFLLRRASDGTTTDIGYGSDNLVDEAAIEAFCSGTTGTVVTPYDQSGNARDVTQATAAQQPTIYTGGAIVKDGSLVTTTKPNTTPSSLGWERGDSIGITGASAVTAFYFAKHNGTGGTNTLATLGTGTGRYTNLYDTLGHLTNWILNGTGVRRFADSPAITTAGAIVSQLGAGAQISTSTMAINGGALAQAALTNGTVTLSVAGAGFTFGMDAGATTGWGGTLNSGIFWGAEVTGGALTALNNFGAELLALSV